MSNIPTIAELYDLNHTIAKTLLQRHTYPWEVLKELKPFILELGATLPADEYDHPEEGVWVAKDAKVIIETCLLTDDEKIKMCEIVSQSGADYIKTSTGFSAGGATFADIELFARHVRGIRIKAAGGIRSVADAEHFLDLGADRLGTSSLIRMLCENK